MYPVKSVLLVLVGILDQSAVWVDEMNYYDMRTDKNKGIPPLSLRPANPLGIEIEKWVLPRLSCLAFHVLKSFMYSGSRNMQGSTTEDASVVGVSVISGAARENVPIKMLAKPTYLFSFWVFILWRKKVFWSF